MRSQPTSPPKGTCMPGQTGPGVTISGDAADAAQTPGLQAATADRRMISTEASAGGAQLRAQRMVAKPSQRLLAPVSELRQVGWRGHSSREPSAALRASCSSISLVSSCSRLLLVAILALAAIAVAGCIAPSAVPPQAALTPPSPLPSPTAAPIDRTDPTAVIRAYFGALAGQRAAEAWGLLHPNVQRGMKASDMAALTGGLQSIQIIGLTQVGFANDARTYDVAMDVQLAPGTPPAIWQSGANHRYVQLRLLAAGSQEWRIMTVVSLPEGGLATPDPVGSADPEAVVDYCLRTLQGDGSGEHSLDALSVRLRNEVQAGTSSLSTTLGVSDGYTSYVVGRQTPPINNQVTVPATLTSGAGRVPVTFTLIRQGIGWRIDRAAADGAQQ
jgi:hypothetical protein